MRSISFALYLNDFHDAFPGVARVGDIMYSNDILTNDTVIVSDSFDGIHDMINSIHTYYNLWNLKFKSKISIFRSGARISNNLIWTYGNQEI